MNSQKTRIIRALLSAGKTGDFIAVRIDRDGLPQQVDSGADTTKAATVLCDETRAEFSRDNRHGRSVKLRRDLHEFRMRLAFPQRVDASLFEADLQNNPIKLPPLDGDPSVIIELRGVDYEHPPTQEPSGGSRFTYTFEAVEGRR